MLYTCNCIPYKIVSTYIQSFFLSWFILENAVLYVHNFSAKCTPPSWIFCDSHTPLKIFFLHMVDSLFIITIWSTAVLEKNVREKIGIWFEVMNMKVSKYYIDFEFSFNFPRLLFPFRYSLYEDCEDWNVHCIFEITPTFCQSACFGKCWNGINWSNSMFNHEDQCRGHFCSGSIKG